MKDSPQASPETAAEPHVFDGWMTRAELAEEIGLTVNTLSKWSSRGIGPAHIRVGCKTMYRRAAVAEWLIEQERKRKGASK